MEKTGIPYILSNQFLRAFTAIYEVLRVPGVLRVLRVLRVPRVLRVIKDFKSQGV